MSMKHLEAAVLGLALALPGGAEMLHVSPDDIVNLGGKGDGYLLFDEAALAGDPKSGTGGTPVTEFTNGYINKDLYYPLETVVDLGRVVDLSDVWWFDINGSDSVEVWCGDGDEWTGIGARVTSDYMRWRGISTTCAGRYVKFRMKSPQSALTEVVLYGTPRGPKGDPPAPVIAEHPTMGALVGMNGFVDDDREVLQAVGNLREYHSWQWDDGNGDASTPAYPGNLFGWAPSWVRGTNWGWDFDDFYGDMHKRGVSMQPVFQGTPAWMFGFAAGDSLKPVVSGADSTDPASYKEHADYMFQFAARYGRTVVPAAKLRVDSRNQVRSGLGFVDWMEGWNEPDKNWKTATGHFSPRVYAAMASADYDGDEGRMGKDVGIRNADPTMKMALPGLISIDLNYVKAVKWWSDRIRNTGFAGDALNFHHYCNDAGGQQGLATTGISPEADDLRGKLGRIAQWRDVWLPGKELWLSEFGWDTDAGSVFRAPATGSADAYEMQARWVVRGFLAVAASGFDRAHVYTSRDSWDASPGTFATSGLVHDKYDTLEAKLSRKVSWYWVNTLHKTLRDFRFDKDLSPGGGFHVFRFVHDSSADSVAFAVWNEDDAAPTSTVDLSTGLVSAVVVDFADKEPLGVHGALPVIGGKVALAGVGGRPRLILGRTGEVVSIGKAGIARSEDATRNHRVDGRRGGKSPGLRLEPLFPVP
ncbi:MAG: hypothetical protein H6686_05885 [Fibrobacteria bacterium]|nr:hypothetical protein [Fibrobacteria bacterium]